jgi:hypothetical protein
MRRAPFTCTIAVSVAVLVTFGVAAQAVTAEATTPPSVVARLAPSHWWTADRTAADAIGTDDGRLLNGAAYGAGCTTAPDDKAFRFDGTGAEVRFNDQGGNFGRNAFTVSFFIKTSSAAHQAVLEKRRVCDANSFWGIRMTDGLIQPELMSDDLANDYTPGFQAATPIDDGAWHQVALVRSGVTVLLYIDGNVDATATTAQPSNVRNNEPLRAGMSVCVGVDGTQAFAGELDELMVFQHALNQGQIRALTSVLVRSSA